MFTGIVEETGVIEDIKSLSHSIRLVVRAKICIQGTKVGDSVSVSGCCLTVVGIKRRAKRKLLQFDLLRETWNRTNLRQLQRGSLVNLERALPVGGRLGGHFVTGHVDGVGTIVRWERSGEDHVLEIKSSSDVMRYVVFKGSIAVDGISLTVAKVTRNSFQVWIIPHTHRVTALCERKTGDKVNLEADLLGKYVERLVTCRDKSG